MADVTANGVRFNVQHLGGGEQTVVFLHGLIVDNLSSWYFTLANPLAKEAEVYLYDLRGHGRSERPPDGYTVDDAVADLDGLLDALGVDHPVHLVGNSFGGVVGLGMALAHPERVAGLALIEAHFAVEGWGQEMAGDLELAAFGLTDETLKIWLGEHGSRKMNKMADNAESLIHQTTLLRDLEAVRPISRAELESVTCPVLAFYGEHSDLLEQARELADLVPGCDLRVLPGCTHSVLMEATSELKRLLVPWVKGEPVPAYRSATETGHGTPAADAATGHAGSRFLFVVPPLTDHVNPTVAVAYELTDRGHQVAWVGEPGVVAPQLPEGARLFPTPATRAADGLPDESMEDTVAAVEAAVEAFGPDVIVADERANAGAVVARRHNLPLATSITTSTTLALEHGDDGTRADEPASDDLVLAFTTEALLGDVSGFGDQFEFVGPSLNRRERAEFPSEWFDDGRRHVLISLGPVDPGSGARFYGAAVEAVTDLDVQAVVLAAPGLVDDVPENVLVRPPMPQLALLAHIDLLVSHAGHNAASESLACGVPMVLAPVDPEQVVVAEQVVRAGAALQVDFETVTAGQLREAIVRVLDERPFRVAATVIMASSAMSGGAGQAAKHLETLARTKVSASAPT